MVDSDAWQDGPASPLVLCECGSLVIEPDSDGGLRCAACRQPWKGLRLDRSEPPVIDASRWKVKYQ
jgi:hypothetical protein